MTLMNLASIRLRTRAEGPGLRIAIWFQGCRRACPGCCNPEMQPLTACHLVPLDALTKRLEKEIESSPDIEGISLIGGEPVLQPAGVPGSRAGRKRAGKPSCSSPDSSMKNCVPCQMMMSRSFFRTPISSSMARSCKSSQTRAAPSSARKTSDFFGSRMPIQKASNIKGRTTPWNSASRITPSKSTAGRSTWQCPTTLSEKRRSAYEKRPCSSKIADCNGLSIMPQAAMLYARLCLSRPA